MGVKKQRPESHPWAGALQPELAEWGQGCPWVVPGHQPWQMPCLAPRFSIRPLPGFLPSRPLPLPFLRPIRAGPVYPDGPGNRSSLRQTGAASNHGWRLEITLTLGSLGRNRCGGWGRWTWVPPVTAGTAPGMGPTSGGHCCCSSHPNPGRPCHSHQAAPPQATCALGGHKTGTQGGNTWASLRVHICREP